MRRQYPDIEKINALVRRLEHGEDISKLANESGFGKSQLHVWLAQYGSGRVMRKVNDGKRKSTMKTTYTSERMSHVSATADIHPPRINIKIDLANLVVTIPIGMKLLKP